MLNVYYFTTAGWGGTGDLTTPVEQNTLWGTALVRRGLTLDQCLTACNPTEVNPVVISPDPDSAEFRDAAGFPLHTVIVPLGANWSINKPGVTLAGGAYRLRFNGGGTHYLSYGADANLIDCDIVGFTTVHSGGSGSTWVISYTRCLLAGNNNAEGAWDMKKRFTDCAIYNNKKGYAGNSGNSNVFVRCIVENVSNFSGTDCIFLKGLSQEQLAATFVKPPKVLDVDNPGYYTDGTAWTIDDWEGVDLRLLSTSEYATGATSVTADEPVFDLAGNKRKPGGAKGAYEVLDDVTHTWKYKNAFYKIDYEDDTAPRVVINRYTGVDTLLTTFDESATYAREAKRSLNGAWEELSDTTGMYDSITDVYLVKRYAKRSGENLSGWTTVFSYRSTVTPPADAVSASTFDNRRGWYTGTGSASSVVTNANSVCYINNNVIFADTASTVATVYIPGWTHVDLGDLTAEVVLGLGATVETSGKLTIKNETATSETSGVVNAGGGVLTAQPGATVVIDGGSFSGVLPPSVELTNDAAVTATGDGVAVVFGADYELPSASTLTLTGGSLTATSATISGTLTTDGTDITATGTLTNDGTLTIDGGDLSIATLTGTTIAISCATATGDSWGVSTLTTTGAASVATLTSSGVVEVGTSATGTTWNVASLSATSAIVTTLTSSGAVEIENESNGETWSATTLTSGACNVDDLTTTGNATINGAATGVDWEIGGALSVPNDAANITTLTAEAVSCDSASGTTWTVASLTTENAANVSSLTTTDAAQIGGDATGSIWSVASLTCAAAEVENLTSTGDVATTENATGDEWECAALDVGGTLDVGVLTATNVESVDAATGTTWDVTTLTAPSATITTLNASGAVAITGDASGSAWSTGNLTIGGAFSVATLALNGASSVPLESVSTLTLGASGALTISENSTVANLTTTDGATITFVDGVFLSATTEATLGETTLDGRGYFALPPETTTTDLTQADGADVRVCEYGAGVTSLTSTPIDTTTISISFDATDENATVLLEKSEDGETWNVVSANITSPYTVQNVTSADLFRTFDGESFNTVGATPYNAYFEIAEDVAEYVGWINSCKITARI